MFRGRIIEGMCLRWGRSCVLVIDEVFFENFYYFGIWWIWWERWWDRRWGDWFMKFWRGFLVGIGCRIFLGSLGGRIVKHPVWWKRVGSQNWLLPCLCGYWLFWVISSMNLSGLLLISSFSSSKEKTSIPELNDHIEIVMFQFFFYLPVTFSLNYHFW